jgi:hypothetical protein
MPTVEYLLQLLRKRLDDELGADSQKNWQNWELCEYLSDGQDEVNKELQLLKSDQDFTETTASGTITITGTTGQITSVSVNGVPIIAAPVPFNGTIAQTATDLATAINAYSQSGSNVNTALTTWLQYTVYGLKYIATANLGVVTITAPSDTGFSPNGYVISAVMTGDMAFTSTSMTGGSCMCKVFFFPGQRYYPIHPKSYIITRFHPEDLDLPIDPITKIDMDNMYPGWAHMKPGIPIRYIPDYISKKVTIIPIPRKYHTVYLDVVRFPYNRFSLSTISASPELPDEYTTGIIPWAMRQAFLKNDRETLNTMRSMKFEQEFYRIIEQTRINHKIRQYPLQPTNYVPNGFL